MKPNKENRGGARPGAGRKPQDGKSPRAYTSIRIDRKAFEAIPAGVNKCDYVSGLIIAATGRTPS